MPDWQPLGGDAAKPSPPAHRDHGPNAFHQAKWPCALKESVDRSHDARSCKRQHEPWGAVFQGIENQHCCDSHQSEKCEEIHESRFMSRDPVRQDYEGTASAIPRAVVRPSQKRGSQGERFRLAM